jgi:hypothetical protein
MTGYSYRPLVSGCAISTVVVLGWSNFRTPETRSCFTSSPSRFEGCRTRTGKHRQSDFLCSRNCVLFLKFLIFLNTFVREVNVDSALAREDHIVERQESTDGLHY